MSSDYAHPKRLRGSGLRGRILPTTGFGRVACWLAVVFLAWLLVWTPLLMVLGEPADVLPQPLFAVITLAGLGAGIAGGVFALLAILRGRERGALVVATLAPALLAIGLLAFELLVPH